jgi:hypothetical protein
VHVVAEVLGNASTIRETGLATIQRGNDLSAEFGATVNHIVTLDQ